MGVKGCRQVWSEIPVEMLDDRERININCDLYVQSRPCVEK